MTHANFTRLSTASFATAPCPIETTAQLQAALEPAQALSEAISLSDMVQATCIELRPLLAHHQITLLLNGDARALPLVFGDRVKLRAALWECMEAAIVHARLEVDPSRSLAMEILFSTDADQVHLTLRNLGAIDMVTLGEPDSCLMPPSGTGGWETVGTERRQHVVFPFARVLLQSLGGNVVVHQTEGAGVACTLSLPRLSSHTGTALRPAHHAQIYAGLLTRLASDDHPPLPQ